MCTRIMFVGSFLLEASLTVKNQFSWAQCSSFLCSICAFPHHHRRVLDPFTFVCNTNFSCQQPTSQYVTPCQSWHCCFFFRCGSFMHLHLGLKAEAVGHLSWGTRHTRPVEAFFCPHCSDIGQGQGDSIFECFWWSCRLYQMTRRSITALSEIGRSHAVMENT